MNNISKILLLQSLGLFACGTAPEKPSLSNHKAVDSLVHEDAPEAELGAIPTQATTDLPESGEVSAIPSDTLSMEANEELKLPSVEAQVQLTPAQLIQTIALPITVLKGNAVISENLNVESAESVVVIKIEGDLTIEKANVVIISETVNPENIVWEVSGKVNLQEGTILPGVIISQNEVHNPTAAVGTQIEDLIVLSEAAQNQDSSTVSEALSETLEGLCVKANNLKKCGISKCEK